MPVTVVICKRVVIHIVVFVSVLILEGCSAGLSQVVPNQAEPSKVAEVHSTSSATEQAFVILAPRPGPYPNEKDEVQRAVTIKSNQVDTSLLENDPAGEILYYDERARIIKHGLFGYISDHGKVVVAPQFAWAADFSEGLAVVHVNGHFGYIDTAGRYVVHPKFDSAFSFYGDHAAVMLDGKWGLIDHTGQFAILPGYKILAPLGHGFYGVDFNGVSRFLDANGATSSQDNLLHPLRN